MGVLADWRETRRLRREIAMADLKVKRDGLQELNGLMEAIARQPPENLKDPDEHLWSPVDTRFGDLDETQRDSLLKAAWKAYYENPFGRNAIRLVEKYVVGRGFSITPQSNLVEVEDYWKAFWVVNRLAKRKKEVTRRLPRDGEEIILLFDQRPPSSGEVGLEQTVPLLRFVKPEEVRTPADYDPDGAKYQRSYDGVPTKIVHGIECSREDIEDVKALWINGVRYPTDPAEARAARPNPKPVVYHDKIFADSEMVRGRSYYEPVLKRISMHDQWQTDRLRLNKIRTAIGLVNYSEGTPAQVNSLAQQYLSSLRKSSGGQQFSKTPEGISMIRAGAGQKYEFLTPNLQAEDAQADGRSVLLSVAAGLGYAEYMLSADSSNANFASTLVAEAPSVKELEDWQEEFECFWQDIFRIVTRHGIAKGFIPETERAIVEERVLDEQKMDWRMDKRVVTQPTSAECDVSFPELVHHDIAKETEAIVKQLDARLVSEITASARLGYDWQEERRKQLLVEDELGADEDEPPVDEEDDVEAARNDLES